MSAIIPPPNSPFLLFRVASRFNPLVTSLSNLSDVRIVILTPFSFNCLSFGNACFTNPSPAFGIAINTSFLHDSISSKILFTIFIVPVTTQISGRSLTPLFSYIGLRSFRIIFSFLPKSVSAFCFVVCSAVIGDLAKYFVGLASLDPIQPFSSSEPNIS